MVQIRPKWDWNTLELGGLGALALSSNQTKMGLKCNWIKIKK